MKAGVSPSPSEFFNVLHHFMKSLGASPGFLKEYDFQGAKVLAAVLVAKSAASILTLRRYR